LIHQAVDGWLWTWPACRTWRCGRTVGRFSASSRAGGWPITMSNARSKRSKESKPFRRAATCALRLAWRRNLRRAI